MASRTPARSVDFWFDYTCPYAYLASTQVEGVAARTGATLRWRPMLLGGVFQAVGTPQRLSETLSPAKARHNAQDLDRWAELFGVPVRWPAGHPLRSVEALRATLVTGTDPRVVHGFYRAYWVEGRAISAPDTLRAVVGAAGHDPEAVLAAIAQPAVKDRLRALTDEAIAAGIFGAPAFVVDGTTLYWGQDRLHFVEGSEAVWQQAPGAAVTRPTGTAHTLEVYWDFSSPFAYLGASQARALADRTGATLIWRPMLLGGLFRSIGQANVPLQTWSEARQRNSLADLDRWAAWWGVPFRFPSRFPMNSLKALRVWLALPPARQDAFREATFRAYWAEDRDISDETELRALIGADADAVLAAAATPAVKQALTDATARAQAVGVFGAPTWVVDGRDLYWGQDRLFLVERALRAGVTPDSQPARP